MIIHHLIRRARPLIQHQQRRFLDLQEYQSKKILHENGIRVQKFKVVSNSAQINDALFPELESSRPPGSNKPSESASRWSGCGEDISQSDEFVIKAQVLAGGRGKGYFKRSNLVGGVQLTKDPIVASHLCKQMLNETLVTKQTGDDGVLVEKVMIAEAVNLKREFYFAILLDRSYDSGSILVASAAGGMDIEEVAEKNEGFIRRFTVPIDLELDFETVRKIVIASFNLQMSEMDLIDQCAEQVMKLYELFLKLDATQIEINPLGVTKEREVICVDAKINFDENARFRHKWLNELEEMNRGEVDKRDYEARKQNLNFIGLDGSIGCLVNGAGLAMATMDIIKLHGGQPANFLDVGGGATAEQVTEAFRIISSDRNVKAIFVNIFGGIMRCDVIAEGIIQATKTLKLNTPIICRLEGTRVNEAKEMIKSSQLNIISCDDFDLAAKTAVEQSQLVAR